MRNTFLEKLGWKHQDREEEAEFITTKTLLKKQSAGGRDSIHYWKRQLDKKHRNFISVIYK